MQLYRLDNIYVQMYIVLTSIVAYSMVTVNSGNTKYGSVTVKSINQAVPPVFMLSTGKLVI